VPRCLAYDIETRGTLSLKQVGSAVYAADPATDIWCVSFCLITDGERGPITTWRPSDPTVPAEILTAFADSETPIVAFNDAFERQIEARVLHPKYGWPKFPLERRRCAQAAALSHALPASLDAIATALKLEVRKSAAGKRAMKLLTQPRKPAKGEDPTQIYWHDTPERLATLYEYNRIDVEITAEIVKRLGFIPPREQQIWQLDAAINKRGIAVDAGLLDAAISIGDQAAAELAERLTALSDGEIISPAQTERILKFLARHGCELPNIQEPTLLEALKRPGLTPIAKELIDLRLEGANAAVSKLATLRRWLGPGNRIRHVYRYHGAMPGRFTSIGAQMQNLKKPAVDDTIAAIADVATGSLKHMQARYERPLSIVGDITRGLIVPAPKHRLFIADLSGIESRGAAWLTNETNKLEAWRQFDQSGDPQQEPYLRFAMDGLHLSGDSARGVGKVADLAFQYQGAIGAWRRLAPAADATPEQKVYDYRRAWVRRHPNIAKFWKTSIRQAVNAIESKDGEPFTVARLVFQRDANFLHLELPSGRRIRYPFARIYADERGKTFTFRDASGGRWAWYHMLKQRGAFGGLILENATQAICRDIFCEAMLRLETRGYYVIAHLHDEFVCEVPDGFGELEEFCRIITASPDWAPDFPIACKGRIADRFIEMKAVRAAPIEREEGITDEPVDVSSASDKSADIIVAVPKAEPELKIAAATAEPEPPPRVEMPPPEFDDPPPRGNGQAGANHTGNGLDAYSAGEQPLGTKTASYIYKDAAGKLFMRVTRTSSKSFPTQHWRDGRWVNGWPSEVVPYRLPELLAARAGEPVWICEGEKDSDNVAALGLIATTNPGGANKFQDELAQYFKGKQIAYVLEDNDDAGRNHTAKVLKALQSIVSNIAVVTFPELPEKGDVSDWLGIGGNRKLLIARAEQALKRTEAHRGYTLIEMRSVPLEATDWLWEGHLIRGELELIAGLPGIGKTQVQCQYMAAASTGRQWPDGQLGPPPGDIIIITAEDKAADYHKRLLAAGADLARIKVLQYVRRNNRNEMFLLSEDLDKLEQAIRDVGAVNLVCIDPITAFMGSSKHFDSHRTTDVRAQLGPLGLLAARVNVAFSCVTHPPKNASQRALDHFIGSQAYIAVARVGHLCIAEMEDSEGERRPSGRGLFANPKGNFSERVPTLAYHIERVKLGYDAKRERDIITTKVVWEGPVEVTADEAVAATRPVRRQQNSARELLLDVLANGPVPQKLVIERGAERGLSHFQLWRALRALGSRPFKQRGEALDSGWLWALPQDVPPRAEHGE
jgi:DNA polymerase